jgi:hypothetical protein
LIFSMHRFRGCRAEVQKYSLNLPVIDWIQSGASCWRCSKLISVQPQVGAENMMIFGLTAQQVTEKQQARIADAFFVENSPRLSRVVQSLAVGEFSPDDPGGYARLVQSVLAYDRFMVGARLDAYWEGAAQDRRAMGNPIGMVAGGDPQHRAHGLVLVGPDDPRICP